MFRPKAFAAASLVILMINRCITAQVTIQQPVFRAFSANTTVSVPDRGAAFIAGIKRAGDSRNSFGFGPFRPGSSVGTFREQANLSAGVWIHDFAAMDRDVLQVVREAHRPLDEIHLTLPAQHAYDALIALDSPHDESRRALVTDAWPSSEVEASGVRARRCYQLGLLAEQRGKQQLARLHFQVAAKYGFTNAKSKLRRTPMVTMEN